MSHRSFLILIQEKENSALLMLLLLKSRHNSHSFHWVQSYCKKQSKVINVQENYFLSGILCDCCSSLLYLAMLIATCLATVMAIV